jgi:hypothetical protein
MSALNDCSIRLDPILPRQVACPLNRENFIAWRPMDPTFRLNRLILGESMLVPREIVKKTERLEVVKPRIVQLREPRDVRQHGIRNSRNIVEAGPNAPKLIRLIRHPYTETVTRPQRGKPWREPREPRIAPEPFGSEVRAAFREGQRPRWPRATREEKGMPERPRVSSLSLSKLGDG